MKIFIWNILGVFIRDVNVEERVVEKIFVEINGVNFDIMFIILKKKWKNKFYM